MFACEKGCLKTFFAQEDKKVEKGALIHHKSVVGRPEIGCANLTCVFYVHYDVARAGGFTVNGFFSYELNEMAGKFNKRNHFCFLLNIFSREHLNQSGNIGAHARSVERKKT
jgi:hypothetical protein